MPTLISSFLENEKTQTNVGTTHSAGSTQATVDGREYQTISMYGPNSTHVGGPTTIAFATGPIAVGGVTSGGPITIPYDCKKEARRQANRLANVNSISIETTATITIADPNGPVALK